MVLEGPVSQMVKFLKATEVPGGFRWHVAMTGWSSWGITGYPITDSSLLDGRLVHPLGSDRIPIVHVQCDQEVSTPGRKVVFFYSSLADTVLNWTEHIFRGRAG